jgi:hypothetical protein
MRFSASVSAEDFADGQDGCARHRFCRNTPGSTREAAYGAAVASRQPITATSPRTHGTSVALPRARELVDRAARSLEQTRSTLVSFTFRTKATPKPDDYSPLPTPAPSRPQLCRPISPTSRKTRVPSCSRLLRLPRPQTRLRARRPLRLKLGPEQRRVASMVCLAGER